MTADKRIFRCNYCSKKYKYESERRRHEKSHFPQFQCKICSKNFSFISALRRHEKQHDRIGTITCAKCGKEFRDEVLLKRHINYAHGVSHTCEKCGSVFNSETALRTHMLTHKSYSEKRFKCSFAGCSKKFNFAHHLKHHELTHTNTKQYFCEICNKGFIQSHHLKTHLKSHNANSSLYCTYSECKKKFSTASTRKKHLAKYHLKPENDVSSDSNCGNDAPLPIISIVSDQQEYDHITSPFSEREFGNEDELTSKFPREETFQNSAVYLSKSYIAVDSINNDINEISHCKTAIGECIMKVKNDKCVCEEIEKPSDHNYDFTPIETDLNFNALNINSYNNRETECCGGKCNENSIMKDDIPNIEYTTNGIVKLKEFLTIDEITDVSQDDDRDKNNDNVILFNSCRSVLGNCIVSGDSTIGDGCFCAKMAIYDQVTAQEIEDITPHPKN